MATGALIASAAIGAAATAVSIRAQRGAQEAREEAAQRQQRLTEFRNARQRRLAVASARISQARARNQATQAGVGESSAVLGSQAAAQSDLASGLASSRTIESLSRARLTSLRRANAISAEGERLSSGLGFLSQTSAGAATFMQNRQPSTQQTRATGTSTFSQPRQGGNQFQTFASPRSVPGSGNVRIERTF